MKDYRKIDTHAHLDMSQFDKDREDVILDSLRSNTICLNMGTDLESNNKVIQIASEYSNLYAGVGLHPHYASSFNKKVLKKIRKLTNRPSVIAIGEIGLDYYRENSPREIQKEVFEAFLDLAIELDLPVSIHNRSSTEDMLNILNKQRFKNLRGAIHSFFGDLALAEKFTELGLMLGISGPVTYPENNDLRSTIRKISIQDILVETDAPYLTPAPYRGKRNQPDYVKYTIGRIAEIKGLSPEEVSEKTTENAQRCFELDGRKQ